MSKKFLYLFKEGHDAFGGDQTTMKNILGGKGAGLAEMTHAGMPVPQGFTITTEACTQYYADNREINDEIKADIFKYMGILEEQTGKKFGDIENPLLVSVLENEVVPVLLSFPNVVITSHQAFFTRTALQSIAAITLENARAFARGEELKNEVKA